MAIRVLLDHGVPQDHIIFLTFLVARQGGIVVLQKAFPQVKIVCSAVDDHLTERWLEVMDVDSEGEGVDSDTDHRKVWVIEPGMGHIGLFSPHCCDESCSSKIYRRSILSVVWVSDPFTSTFCYPHTRNSPSYPSLKLRVE